MSPKVLARIIQKVQTYLHLTGGVEVLESLGDTGGHGLLTLADPDTGLNNKSQYEMEWAEKWQKGVELTSKDFLLGLSAPSGLPTAVMR